MGSAVAGENKQPEGSMVIQEAPLVSTASHDAFFDAIAAYCGQAFAGKVTSDIGGNNTFNDKKLVMHVRKCAEHQLQIPFHIGDDASRTWLITKTGSGLSLKHDHRQPNGNHDVQTMYGGHTTDAGWSEVQSFPVDQYSKELFIQQGIPQSATNTWQIFIYPNRFSYRLIRKGREFRVDFDLTKPINTPPAPWGYAD
ncbi:hypothetical protein DXX93_14010 [Thalassotalea euphylliae]|uniref:Secreted protein n=1 Tax=Thalassotalea euphylliae TaxID=1655234 RepID=A0A3E0TW96_9GAMM|nr:hypothetical protein [Thalassotalea euphylliae]REL28951.1 hypothetical protein DXX93_14010 [Thalassotalea euphylliae]